jgi:hypothetical protein
VDAQTLSGNDEADRLRQLVQAQFRGRVRDFCVLARDGGLVLQGRVASYHLKQSVQEAVIGATTACVLANEIMVV